jgi:crotonobetaine/carnitine-CoA ligase
VFIATPPDGLSEPARVGSEISELTVALLDDLDGEVGTGVVGELCFRPNEPFMAMQGYWRKPEATFATWRNLWFHTGDLLRRDEFGQLEYIGRKKDSIRRRGENVSAWEVEQAVSSHPDVLEAAAIGVPSDVGEEDVAVLVVLKHGRTLDPEVLVRFVERDLQRFAVPRYVEFVTSLPKTPSERIAKGEVRARGITADAWDAAAALGRR